MNNIDRRGARRGAVGLCLLLACAGFAVACGSSDSDAGDSTGGAGAAAGNGGAAGNAGNGGGAGASGSAGSAGDAGGSGGDDGGSAGAAGTDGGSGGSGGAGGAAGSGGSGGSSGSGGSAGASSDAGGLCGTAGGACVDATDCAIGKSQMETWEGSCAQSSLGDSKKTATCMEGKGVTSPCAACWGDVAACGAKNCLAQCIGGSQSQQCRDCTKAAGCDDAFTACSGI